MASHRAGCWVLALLFVFVQAGLVAAQALPVRGLCIAAPAPAQVERFAAWITNDFAARGVNTLILRVDFNFAYESHPKLRGGAALSKADVARLVGACRAAGIQLIPQINLLGHQSWQTRLGKLLEVYPEFDETPWVKLPEKYQWPNPDRLYCKSYCPLHPEVHKVVFALVDELCDAFEARAFHGGMDEVFYLGEDRCPRCAGKDKSELFAGEVNRLHQHLKGRGRELWIWGDRLLDGRTTGVGEWEGSYNDTHRAIDLISKEVVICDWHYERAHPTPVYFALKGFRVVACPWNRAEVGVQQVRDMFAMRERSAPAVRNRLLGVVQTVWSGVDAFWREWEGLKTTPALPPEKAPVARCFMRVSEEWMQRPEGGSAAPQAEKKAFGQRGE